MPLYLYSAKNRQGELKKGSLNVIDKHDLAKSLRAEGYVLISADIEKKKLRIKVPKGLSFLDRVSLTEKSMFVRNLQVMIASGIPLPRALNILSEQTKTKKFKKIVLNIRENIIKGSSFSDAVSNYKNVFAEIFVNMIKVGEESGTLEETLGVLNNQMEKEYELKSKILGALIYPAVILTAMFFVGIIMLIVVVPELSKLFTDLGIELPFTTRVVIGIGDFLSKYWYTLPFLFMGSIVLFNVSIKTTNGKKIFDKITLNIPLISAIIKKTYAARTIRTLSSLVSAGIPIVRSLEIVAGGLNNIYYKQAIMTVSKKVQTGQKIAEALEPYSDLYPSLVIQMIRVGEETGKTSSILAKLADFFETEVANATKNLSAIIEPVLMLVIGTVIGFFAISMIQPIYSMLDGV